MELVLIFLLLPIFFFAIWSDFMEKVELQLNFVKTKWYSLDYFLYFKIYGESILLLISRRFRFLFGLNSSSRFLAECAEAGYGNASSDLSEREKTQQKARKKIIVLKSRVCWWWWRRSQSMDFLLYFTLLSLGLDYRTRMNLLFFCEQFSWYLL